MRGKVQQLEGQGQPEVAATPENLDKAREAVRERVQEEQAIEPTAAMPPALVRRGQSPVLNFPTLQGPALPISPAKHQRLDDLLQRYKADQITPEQYQAERARILSEQ